MRFSCLILNFKVLISVFYGGVWHIPHLFREICCCCLFIFRRIYTYGGGHILGLAAAPLKIVSCGTHYFKVLVQNHYSVLRREKYLRCGWWATPVVENNLRRNKSNWIQIKLTSHACNIFYINISILHTSPPLKGGDVCYTHV